MLGTPVVLAFVGNNYKLNLSNGQLIKSESPIYILEKPMSKKVNGAKITLTSFVVNTQDKDFVANEEIENLKGYKYIKHEMRVNGDEILKDEYDKIDVYSWSNSYGRPYEYNKDDEIVFSILLKDELNKVTKIDYNIELVEATSMEQYNKYLPNDTNNKVTVSAIIKEENNIMYIDLKAIPSVDNFDFQVDSFGNYNVINNKTNIFLIDNNGKKVEVQPEIKDRSGTNFKVNIENLQKPFTLELGQINVSVDDLNSKKVKLPSLELNETNNINKVIDISDSKNIISEKSSKVLIKNIKRINSNGENAYNIKIDYPDNENSFIKIRSLNIEHIISPLTLFKLSISGMSQASSKDNICRNATVYLSKNKKKKVYFEISGGEYFIEGKWKLKID